MQSVYVQTGAHAEYQRRFGVAFFISSSTASGVRLITLESEDRPSRRFTEWFTVSLLFRGSGVLHYRGRTIEACPNLVNVIEPGELHHNSVIRTPLDCAALEIDANIFLSIADALGYRGHPHFPVNFQPAHPAVLRAHAEFCGMVRAPGDHAEVALACLVAALLEHCAEEAWQAPTWSCQDVFESIVEAARSDDACPPVAELASKAGLSQRQLFRNFRKEVGASPYELFQLVRLARVFNEVGQTSSLADLAIRIGFADQSHMNRVFKRLTHLSVGRYRTALFGEGGSIVLATQSA